MLASGGPHRCGAKLHVAETSRSAWLCVQVDLLRDSLRPARVWRDPVTASVLPAGQLNYVGCAVRKPVMFPVSRCSVRFATREIPAIEFARRPPVPAVNTLVEND